MKNNHEFRPKKSLGQHFLKDIGIVQEIINKARFDPTDRVLEIGPGLGALTLLLAREVYHIIAVEKDSRLADILNKRLSDEKIDNVFLINEDILKLDFNRVPSLHEGNFVVIGNLPYNISSPILEKLVENRQMVNRAVLMLQSELAGRLIANPGTKAFGAMTVFIQYHAHVAPLLHVPKEAFRPRPKVDSMVLEMDFQRPYPERTEDDVHFRRVVKGAFAQRRKTLINSLKNSFVSCSREEILSALEKCDMDPKRRAETLTIGDFLRLSSALKAVS
ncbi:MAG: ribosomal RNA small subunit methyltransferase A [Deltaproteobacteria bacterium]|nr:ribosomal RNA small subunit methyltransferase A [Deltaproteobacteria bacterium]